MLKRTGSPMPSRRPAMGLLAKDEEEPELLSTPGKGGIFLQVAAVSGLLAGETSWAASQELPNAGCLSLTPCHSHHV